MRYSILIICFFSISFINAQCAFEKELLYYVNNLTNAKIIELEYRTSLTGMSVGAKPEIPGYVSNEDVFLTKQDSCGNIIWQKQYAYNESSFDGLVDILELPNNEIIMVTYSENDGIGGAYNIVVWKLNANGDVLWNKYYGGGTNATAAASVFYNNSKNTILIAGQLERPSPSAYLQRGYLLEIDTSGNVLHERDIIMNSVQYSSSARLIVRYAYTLPDASILAIATALSDRDSIYAVKLDSNFNLLWVRYPLLGTFKQTSPNIGIHPNKNQTRLALYFGSAEPKSGFYVAELDSSGLIVKSGIKPETPDPSGHSLSIIPTNSNGYIIGWDLLIIDSNLEFKSFRKFNDDLRIQSYRQMRNGAIVYAGYKSILNDTYAKGYIAQTNEKGWVLANKETTTERNTTIKLFPNPANQTITIESNLSYSVIELVSITGQSIIQEKAHAGGIEVSNIPDGFYMLRLLGAQQEVLATQKVSVLH